MLKHVQADQDKNIQDLSKIRKWSKFPPYVWIFTPKAQNQVVSLLCNLGTWKKYLKSSVFNAKIQIHYIRAFCNVAPYLIDAAVQNGRGYVE